MGTGIRTTRHAIEEAGPELPRFTDNGIRFTVHLPNYALHSRGDLAWLGRVPGAGLTSPEILATIATWTRSRIESCGTIAVISCAA